MARAVWTGTISFGLVSVPVRLYPATRRKDVRFHEIDRLSGQRIRHQRVVEPAPFRPPLESARATRAAIVPEAIGVAFPQPAPFPTTRPVAPASQPVPAGDVLNGFEVANDRDVTVDRGELARRAAARRASQARNRRGAGAGSAGGAGGAARGPRG